MGTYVSAASASTFSRSWHAPPPLIELRLSSTLRKVRESGSVSTRTAPHIRQVRRSSRDALVGAVDADVNLGVRLEVAEREASLGDERARLEACERDRAKHNRTVS